MCFHVTYKYHCNLYRFSQCGKLLLVLCFCGWGLGVGVFLNSPGEADMQPGLRAAPLSLGYLIQSFRVLVGFKTNVTNVSLSLSLFLFNIILAPVHLKCVIAFPHPTRDWHRWGFLSCFSLSSLVFKVSVIPWISNLELFYPDFTH